MASSWRSGEELSPFLPEDLAQQRLWHWLALGRRDDRVREIVHRHVMPQGRTFEDGRNDFWGFPEREHQHPKEFMDGFSGIESARVQMLTAIGWALIATVLIWRTRGTLAPAGRPSRGRLPLVANGQHTFDNVQASHLICNVRKGGRT